MAARHGQASRLECEQARRELYSSIAQLGERIYYEAMALGIAEEEAAAIASANLVLMLEKEHLLARIADAHQPPHRPSFRRAK